MRVRISYVVDVSDQFCHSLMKFLGKAGRASWEDIEEYFFLYGITADKIEGSFKVREEVGGPHKKVKKRTRRLPRVG